MHPGRQTECRLPSTKERKTTFIPLRHKGATEPRASRKLARPAGFEPAAYGLEVRCSIQLSYGRPVKILSRSQAPSHPNRLLSGGFLNDVGARRFTPTARPGVSVQ